MFFDEQFAAEYLAISVKQRISRTDSVKEELLRLYFRDGCNGGVGRASSVLGERRAELTDRREAWFQQRASFHHNVFVSIVRAPVWTFLGSLT